MDDAELIAENTRLNKLINDTASHWLTLQYKHPIAWEGAIDGAMQAACGHIEALTAEVERLKYDGIHTCSDTCQRVACVLRREVEDLKDVNNMQRLEIESLIEARAALQPQEKVG